jgi:hypothetical protein
MEIRDACRALALVAALAVASVPGPGFAEPQVPSVPRIEDVMVGDWTMVGTAKDSPTGPEYKVTWKLHGRRILGGAFVQVDQAWKGNGQESHAMEIIAYDPASRTHSTFAFSDDRSHWVGTATYADDGTLVETGTTTGADGKVTTWRDTYVYSADRMSVTGTEEAEKDGVKWTTFTVKGTKARRPSKEPGKAKSSPGPGAPASKP